MNKIVLQLYQIDSIGGNNDCWVYLVREKTPPCPPVDVVNGQLTMCRLWDYTKRWAASI